MYLPVVRFLALCGALALAVGCGGLTGSSSTGPANSPSVVAFTITGVTPSTIATKVGSGPFTSANLTSGTLTISLPSGVDNFAVAYRCSTPLPPYGGLAETEQDVYEATTLDGSSFTASCLAALAPPTLHTVGTLTGSADASAIPGASSVEVFASANGFGTSFNSPFANATSFGFSAPTGPDRVLVLAYNNIYSPPASAGSTTLAAAKSFDSQAVPGAANGGNSVVLGAADETTPVAITYGNLPAGFVSQGTAASLIISSGGSFVLAAPATAQYPAVPAAAIESGDYYSVNTIASNGTEVTSVTKTSTTAAPIAFAFPANWSYAGPTASSSPTYNVAYSGLAGSNNISYLASWNWQPDSSDQDLIAIHATANYLNGTTTIALPDLSGVTGLVSPPASGIHVNWRVSIAQIMYASQTASAANATVTSVANSGTYVVP